MDEPLSIKKKILKVMKKPNFSPMGKKALFSRLQLDKSLLPLYSKVLDELLDTETIQLFKRQYSLAKKKTVKGILFAHPRGFGFVQPESGSITDKDVFIPKHSTLNGISEDIVEVEITSLHSPRGPEGKIISIIERKKQSLIGIITFEAKDYFEVFVPVLGPDKQVFLKKGKKTNAKKSDRVEMNVLSWGKEKKPTKCELMNNLGPLSDASIDIDIAAKEHDINNSFPAAVVNESKIFGKTVTPKDLKNRKDLTHLNCITIDPDTAKDFDDALSLEKDSKGNFLLGVHIADVSHYITPNGPLDKEAYNRGNSTYFPGKCIPMLPESLSNELCSLKPDVIRLTVSVLMKLDKNGTLIDYEIVRSYIKSRKRFTYKEAFSILEKNEKSPFSPLLNNLKNLCILLKKEKRKRGSIDFALPETVVFVDKKGVPTGMETIEYDITHQLVEEFMLKANEIVAKHLYKEGNPSIYRIHESPKEDGLEDFFYLANVLGFPLPKEPTREDLQNLFEKAKDTPYLAQLAIQYIRSMKLAFYSPDNIGHFGLSLEYYTHFTSPIRRYSDLIIHRLLFHEKIEDIAKIATNCSEKERKSMRAENSVILLKKLRLLGALKKQDPNKTYIAKITKILPFKIIFDLSDYSIEGSIHLSDIHSDFFEINKDGSLYGNRTGQSFSLGDLISVRLKQVNLIYLESSWIFIEK